MISFIIKYNNVLAFQNPQNGQAHLINLSAVADKLFECVSTFLGLALKG